MKRILPAVTLAAAVSVLSGADIVYTEPQGKPAVTRLFLAENNSVPAPHQTRVYFRHEGKTLLIRAEMEVEPSYQAPQMKNGKGIWPDCESVEIFLDPEGKGKSYFQLAAGIDGSLFDSRLKKKAWKPDWTCSVEHQAGRWTAEFRIPADVRKGACWGFNFCRNVKESSSYSSAWAKVGSAFHNPGRFGSLYFGSREEIAKMRHDALEEKASLLRKRVRRFGAEKEFPRLFEDGYDAAMLENYSDELEVLETVRGVK